MLQLKQSTKQSIKIPLKFGILNPIAAFVRLMTETNEIIVTQDSNPIII